MYERWLPKESISNKDNHDTFPHKLARTLTAGMSRHTRCGEVAFCTTQCTLNVTDLTVLDVSKAERHAQEPDHDPHDSHERDEHHEHHGHHGHDGGHHHHEHHERHEDGQGRGHGHQARADATGAEDRLVAMCVDDFSMGWSSYVAPVFDMHFKNPEVWVRFEDLLLRRNNWKTLSEHGFPPPYDGGLAPPEPKATKRWWNVAGWRLGGDRVGACVGEGGGGARDEAAGGDAGKLGERQGRGGAARQDDHTLFKRPRLRRWECVGECTIHFVSQPLGGMQIMPPVKLDGQQLTKLLEDAFFEWGGGGPIDFEDMPSAVMHALMKAALDKLDEVDEVADQVLARARMLRGTLKDSLQHYIAESAHLLSSGAFGALHEAMHRKAGEGRSPTPL
mmetsp:Transcript_61256/g.168054  ORF Transcript_61256/g.168054 Transcript_61256/m.168054 type:complete len:391 (+) Transcript_61256:107-1279(+)